MDGKMATEEVLLSRKGSTGKEKKKIRKPLIFTGLLPDEI